MRRARASIGYPEFVLRCVSAAIWCAGCVADKVAEHAIAGPIADVHPTVIGTAVLSPPFTLRLGTLGHVIAASGGRVLIHQDKSWHYLTPPTAVAAHAGAGSVRGGVWIYDSRARVLLIRNHEEVWRGVPLPTLVAGYEQSVIGVLNDGTPVLLSRAPERFGVPNIAFVWIVSNGRVVVLDSLAGTSSDITLVAAGGSAAIVNQPWGSQDLAVLSADRRGVLVVKSGQTVGDSVELCLGRYEAPGYAPALSKMRLRRWPLSESDVTEWERQLVRGVLASRLGGSGEIEAQLLAQLDRPAYLPTFTEVADLGMDRLLLERPSGHGARRWIAYSRNGRVVYDFEPADTWHLSDARHDTLLWVSYAGRAVPDTMYTGRLGGYP